MSIDSALGGVRSLTNTVTSGVNSVTRLGADLGLGGTGGKGANWKDTLRPATYRGIGFTVLASEGKFGRRNAVHEYPFRDTPWVEDTGRGARRFNVVGYIVGDDCVAQRDRLIAACESEGDGELVHPTYGRRNVALMDFAIEEQWDHGRMFQLMFSFVEQGKREFPSVATSTADAVTSAAGLAKLATGSDFLSTVAGALKSGLAVATQAISTVQGWVSAAQRLVNDATNVFHFVQSLPGAFGRIFGSHISPSAQKRTTIPLLLARGALARNNVTKAGRDLGAAANGLITVASLSVSSSVNAGAGPAATVAVINRYTAAAQQLADAVAAIAISPPDALRLLTNLVAAVPGVPPSLVAPVYPITPVFPTPAAQSVALMASASSDLFRRVAVIALAQASSNYQPSSYDDAVEVRTLVVDQLDAEIEIAGNQGQDATFNALRGLRTAVVHDLTERGASLAQLVQVATPQSMPALALAQRLYKDGARSEELIVEANPIHPAFMPPRFKALAK